MRAVRRPARGFFAEFLIGMIAGIAISVWITSTTVFFQRDQVAPARSQGQFSISTSTFTDPPTLATFEATTIQNRQSALKEIGLGAWSPKKRQPSFREPIVACLVLKNSFDVNPLVVNATWGSRCDRLIFQGPRLHTEGLETIDIAENRTQGSGHESWFVFREIIASLKLTQVDFLFVVDDMTYGVPDNIRYEFRGDAPGEEKIVWARKQGDRVIWPNAFVLSRSTILELQERISHNHCRDSDQLHSELVKCAPSSEIREDIDFNGKHQIMTDPMKLLAKEDLPAHLMPGVDCCSVLPLAFVNVGRNSGVKTGKFSYHYFYDYFIRDTAVFGKEWMRPLNGLDAGIGKPQIGF